MQICQRNNDYQAFLNSYSFIIWIEIFNSFITLSTNYIAKISNYLKFRWEISFFSQVWDWDWVTRSCICRLMKGMVRHDFTGTYRETSWNKLSRNGTRSGRKLFMSNHGDHWKIYHKKCVFESSKGNSLRYRDSGTDLKFFWTPRTLATTPVGLSSQTETDLKLSRVIYYQERRPILIIMA